MDVMTRFVFIGAILSLLIIARIALDHADSTFYRVRSHAESLWFERIATLSGMFFVFTIGVFAAGLLLGYA